MTELTELLTRVEMATGPSRSLDLDLHIALGLAESGAEEWGPYLRRRSLAKTVDAYTYSIDAALVLVKQKLPESDWAVSGGKGLLCEATIWPQTDRNHEVVGKASTPPLAIIGALLRALSVATKENLNDEQSPEEINWRDIGIIGPALDARVIARDRWEYGPTKPSWAGADNTSEAEPLYRNPVPTKLRPETQSEHIMRDIREGRFPEQSERQMVPDNNENPDPTSSEQIEKLIDALTDIYDYGDKGIGLLPIRQATSALAALMLERDTAETERDEARAQSISNADQARIATANFSHAMESWHIATNKCNELNAEIERLRKALFEVTAYAAAHPNARNWFNDPPLYRLVSRILNDFPEVIKKDVLDRLVRGAAIPDEKEKPMNEEE